ncbi:hypothetical protein BGZ95_011040 [Linnemannia exigua]|uniref:FAD/NAD(P)-binding domain-containing protein n=1 Tax=Linnemannia exigua TaxID=604196 RepID=A0AAD4DB09_9FUNG|nr:hypothetical protein BGZ95_011040 [Linnemannia exigua]
MGLTKTYPDGTSPTVAVIGAGLSGLCAAIQLQRQLQLTTYTVYELEAEIGGTWYSNSYPGCQSDAPSHIYSYSFAPNYDFTKKFIKQSEMLAYLRSTAKTFNIYDKIRFKTRIVSMQWHETRRKWILHWAKDELGEEGQDEVDVVIHGAGVLRLPNIPKEYEAFEGEMWHSARWNHTVDISGKRVGVVGMSASGAQIIPAIADQVQSLEVYGRTPYYITPQRNRTYTRIWTLLFRYLPFFYAFYRAFTYYYVDSTFLLYNKLAWHSVFHRAVVYFVTWWHRFRHLPNDPRLRQQLTPQYEIASRRIILSDTFFPTFKKSNVRLHSEPIVSVEGKKIKTRDGVERELDVLVLATGFDWVSNFPPGYLTGRNGIDISTNWGESPTTYYGTTVPLAPNFFLIWGPNSGVAHHALTSMVELQVSYAIRAISYMMKNDLESMEIKQSAAEDFLKLLDRRIERTVFTTTVMPKFLNSMGQCRGFWFGSCTEFWLRTRDLPPELYDVVKREEGRKGQVAASGRMDKKAGDKHYEHLNGDSTVASDEEESVEA